MAKTSYAKAAELAAKKRAKFEKQLEDAIRTGDRFAINAAQRSIDKLAAFEEELYNSQESKKAAKGIGNPQDMMPQPMFAVGGNPTDPPQFDMSLLAGNNLPTPNQLPASQPHVLTGYNDAQLAQNRMQGTMVDMQDRADIVGQNLNEAGQYIAAHPLDAAQVGLGAVAIGADGIPVVGNAISAGADLLNAGISGGRSVYYANKGDAGNAAFYGGLAAMDLAAAAPGLGNAAGASKIGALINKGVHATGEIGHNVMHAAHTGSQGATAYKGTKLGIGAATHDASAIPHAVAQGPSPVPAVMPMAMNTPAVDTSWAQPYSYMPTQMAMGGKVKPMYAGGGDYPTNPPLKDLTGLDANALEALFKQVQADPRYNTYVKDKYLTQIRQAINAYTPPKDPAYLPDPNYDPTTQYNPVPQGMGFSNEVAGYTGNDFRVPADTPTPEPAPTPKKTIPTAPKKREAEALVSLTPKAVDLNLQAPTAPQLWTQDQLKAMAPTVNTNGASQAGNGLLSNVDLKSAAGLAKNVVGYGAQFLPDVMALRQLKKLDRPENMPMAQTPLINTDVDTSATRAAIEANRLATNASLDTGMANASNATNAKLAALVGANRQMADVYQNEYNQEQQLRNQQIGMANETLNKNLMTNYANAQQQADFNNMITNARLGIMQGMGTKAFQMNQEFNKMNLDRRRLETLARQFDPGLLQRNFTNIELFRKMANNASPEQLKQLKVAMDQSPTVAQQIQTDDPQLYNKLMNLQ